MYMNHLVFRQHTVQADEDQRYEMRLEPFREDRRFDNDRVGAHQPIALGQLCER